MVKHRPATINDIRYIAARLRTEDAEEIKALSGINVLDALIKSFQTSQDCFVGEESGKVFCIVGCVPDCEGASLWMLFTKDVEYLPMSFFKISQKVLNQWLDKYGYLHNYTLKGNIFILKWLKLLKFTIEPLSLFANLEVHQFWKRR